MDDGKTAVFPPSLLSIYCEFSAAACGAVSSGAVPDRPLALRPTRTLMPTIIGHLDRLGRCHQAKLLALADHDGFRVHPGHPTRQVYH